MQEGEVLRAKSDPVENLADMELHVALGLENISVFV